MKFRSVPEGIRRFATWGPLLIPFYIPRGAEWEYVWNRSDVVRAEGLAFSPPVASVVSAYACATAATLLLCFAVMVRRRLDPHAGATSDRAGTTPMMSREFSLGTGVCSLDIRADGCGFSRALSKVRHGAELDVTHRPSDSYRLRGKFFYLRELGSDGEPLEEAKKNEQSSPPKLRRAIQERNEFCHERLEQQYAILFRASGPCADGS